MKKKSILVLSLIATVLILIAGCSSPSVQFGKLTINSTPLGASVYIDGVNTGSVTPLVKNLEAGDHTIKLTKDFYENWQDIVTVVANQDESINPALESATIVQETIKPANFALYYATSGLADLPLGLYKVLEEWDEAIISWNNQPTCSTESEYTLTIYSGSTTGVYKHWYNLTDLIQGWLDGSIVNYGMMIRDADESSLDTMAWVGSSEADEEYRPKLTINYYIP